MKYQKTIDELLTKGCPSIQYRIRTEILGESASSLVNRNLQKEILDDPLVKEALSWQLPDGHFGKTLTDDILGTGTMLGIVHGRNGFEQAMKILSEKGVSAENGQVAKALATMEALPQKARLDGFIAIANAWFRQQEKECSSRTVSEALSNFKVLATLEALEDILGKGRKRVFKRGILWPTVSDIAMLAVTDEWRCPENRSLMKTAVSNIIRFHPEPENVSGQFIRWGTDDKWGTYEVVWFKMSSELPEKRGQWTREWFKNLEHLSRMPFLLNVNPVKGLLEELMSLMDKTDGWFKEPVSSRSFLRWLWAYDGLALEPGNSLKPPYEWHSEEGRIRDLTFRCILILHNFGLLNE